MKAEIKAKWLEALRSGKYLQTRGALREGNSFCCLGVLCDIHHKETGTEWEDEGHYFGEPGELPVEVQKWARIRTSCVNIKRQVRNRSALTELNDDGLTFQDIADVIEKQL